MFSGWAFGGHLDTRFGFRSIFDNLLDLANFASIKRWENILYSDDFFCVVRRLKSLQIQFATGFVDGCLF